MRVEKVRNCTFWIKQLIYFYWETSDMVSEVVLSIHNYYGVWLYANRLPKITYYIQVWNHYGSSRSIILCLWLKCFHCFINVIAQCIYLYKCEKKNLWYHCSKDTRVVLLNDIAEKVLTFVRPLNYEVT